jgi:hypothetical protein
MLLTHKQFSPHGLKEAGFIDITSMIRTLNGLRMLNLVDRYNVANTQCKTDPLRLDVIDYFKKEGVCTDPIVVTDDDFCLDGRHRVTYRKQINDTICSAYIVPREYVNKFIKKY